MTESSGVPAPKPGRMAFICEHKDHFKSRNTSPPRIFVTGDADIPMCRDHGPMKVQPNHPYFGQPIPVD